jgi:hypothetical protein
MKARLSIHLGLLGGTAALILLGLLPQGGTLAALRERVAATQVSRRAPASGPAATPPASTRPAPRTELTSAEKLEQARLRAQLTRLREQQRALAGAEEENRRLRAELARGGTNRVGGRVPLPPGYVRRSSARMQGFDTPEHALETFLWAIERQDTNSLFAAVAPSETQSLLDLLTSQGTEAFFRELAKVPGFVVLRQDDVGEDQTRLWVEYAPGTAERPWTFQRIDGQWRLQL